MKKLFWLLAPIMVHAFLGSHGLVADAAVGGEEKYCRPPRVSPVDSNNQAYWEYKVRKHDSNFVLDYFQDPDEHGVSLTVTIRAMPLLAIYSKWEDICQPYSSPQRGGKACTNPGGFAPGGGFAYWTRSCVAQPPEETYRSIEKRTVVIWLEPSAGTRDLLGKGPWLGREAKPVLRYLYPDQWAILGMRPGVRTVIEGPRATNGADVKKSLLQNRDFFVLEPDVTDDRMVSRLTKIQSPVTGGEALLLFGQDGKCRVNLAAVGDRDVCSYSVSEKTPGYGIIRFTATLNRIPLDVPGEWYIGVSFYQRAAVFDGGRGVEPAEQARMFVFSNEAKEKEFSFESYIIRSAPCNPDEPWNCWENG